MVTSQRSHLALAVALGGYVALFLALHSPVGSGIASLAALPAAVAGHAYGMRGGVIAGLLLIPLNTILLNLRGVTGVDALIQSGGLPGSVVIILVGGAVGRLRDMSDRLEAQRKEAESARLAAEQSVQQRDHFLAAASHDLQTPLASIRLSSHRLRRELSRLGAVEGSPAAVELSYVDAAAAGLQHTIADLQDMARLQIGHHLQLDREPIELLELARKVADEQRRGPEPHTVQVETEDGEGEIVGQWDRARLERVVANLVGNAVKYSAPEGGDVVVRVGRQNGWAVLSVEDHGIGIPEEDLAHVFDHFARARNASRRRGLGIGLAAVRQIVEEHGGTIHAQSREGVGSVFTVRLPL